MIRILLIFIINIFLLGNSYATHLVRGNLAYEFVGIQPNGDFRYTLKLNYYFDCGANSNWQPQVFLQTCPWVSMHTMILN